MSLTSEVRSRFLRFYLYAGACFIVFNLCFWEHFALGCGFSAILSALFGGIGLYYIAKATQASAKWKSNLLVGLVFLIASVLSLGAGYAATAAAISLLAFSGLKKLAVSRPMPRYRTVVYCLACALGLLAIVAHPFFHLTGRIIKAVYHSVLVAGSTGSSFIDKNSLMAQNVAFACGIILVVASLSIGFDFLTRQTPRNRLLPIFSLALVLFGFSAASQSQSLARTAQRRVPQFSLYALPFSLPSRDSAVFRLLENLFADPHMVFSRSLLLARHGQGTTDRLLSPATVSEDRDCDQE